MTRIQYRQLVDILARPRPNADLGPQHERGLERIAELSDIIPARERGAMLAALDRPLCNPQLVALLAGSEPAVATTAIASAALSEAEWLALIPQLPVRARGILRHRRDLGQAVEALLERLGITDRGLPPATGALSGAPAVQDAPVPAPAAPPPPPDDIDAFLQECEDTQDALDKARASALQEAAGHQATPAPAMAPQNSPRPASSASAPISLDLVRARATGERARAADAGIGAIVRRIEEFRKAREHAVATAQAGEAPYLPLADLAPEPRRGPATIDFATDVEGRITWVEGPFASALVGFSLATAAQGPARSDDEGFRTGPGPLRSRQPWRALPVHIDGAPAVAGEWQADAVARFDPVSGRFTGYCGRLRRPLQVAQDVAPSAPAPSPEADSMRQILHELRNPANAIQVAAEIIQQQLYGPAPHEYRALAAAIAGDVAQILAGFDELDRLVKLETGASALAGGECDLAEVLGQTVSRLQAWTAPRRSGFAIQAQAASLPVKLDRQEVERMVWRLLAALAGSTAPDEQLALRWWCDTARSSVEIELPGALAKHAGEALFSIPAGERGTALSAGMFGIGFTLRLAAAEAKSCGGKLYREDNMLRLDLPGLTASGAGHSNLSFAIG